MPNKNKQNLKEKVLTKLLQICIDRGDDVFHNNLIKDICKEIGFGNPFDVTKIDTSDKPPQIFQEKDTFIVHLGSGKNRFVKGISNRYHEFEEIPRKTTHDWSYKKSLLNEFDTSESNILSIGFNQRIIHDFLYKDVAENPKVYNSRRTKKSIQYKISDERISTSNLQMEMDQTFELEGQVTIIEGKMGFLKILQSINFIIHSFIILPYGMKVI